MQCCCCASGMGGLNYRSAGHAARLRVRQVAQLVEHEQVDAADAVGDVALAAELDLGLQLVDDAQFVD